ncbi:MAG: VOC family protein [Candidatus Omnitrophica bacterium]|nr:VOC family protein [Candidatus Omnitrophota bacterium]
MSKGNFVKLDPSCPIIAVGDVPATMAYYVEKLGFQKNWDWGDPVTFGSVVRDGVALFFSADGRGRSGVRISIVVEDVDVLYTELQRRGTIVAQPPTQTPVGAREIYLDDLNGHRLCMATDIPQPVSAGPIME